MATTTIDFSPLSIRVPEPEVKAWKAQAKASGQPWASPRVQTIIALALVIPLLVGLFAFLISMLGRSVIPDADGNPIGALLFLILVVVGLATIAIVVVKAVGVGGRRWELWARVDRFARANGMTFSPRDANPAYPGAIFGIGRERQAVDHLRRESGRFFDFGNYQYTTGSGKRRTTRTWGFLAFRLDRRLPHMVLDSKANNGFFGTNLPTVFDKDQILSLEGDFDRHFTLYCPRAYERDALYVFTPDLMALLIDEAAPFDVEIVDDWMFVYSSAPFRIGDANLYARLFRIIDTVGAKTLTQTDRYVDERVGDFRANIVAPEGARLKRGISVGAIVIGVLMVGYWALRIFGEFAGR